jgi:hypothetical protein
MFWEKPEISEKNPSFDPHSGIEPDYKLFSVSKMNKNNEVYRGTDLKHSQYSKTSLKEKDTAAVCVCENAPVEFYAAKDRGEVKPGISFDVWWREK